MTNYEIKQFYANKLDHAVGKHGTMVLSSNKFDHTAIESETEKYIAVKLVFEYWPGKYKGRERREIVRALPREWIMTSEEAPAYYADLDRRFELGCKRYEKLLKWGKDNGVKGLRVGLGKVTIQSKIRCAGLTPPTDEELDAIGEATS